ncbi:MAG TPA: response regulator [Stellaceae bacterium]|nr:response regulator [Stellaceae bacterium]
MIADSERAICAFVASVLEDIGYRVVCCATAAEAMHIARQGNIACALIEMMLPDGWGTNAADDIAGANVPVILMSGHPEGLKRSRASRHVFLQKPFGVQELLRAVVDQVVADGLRER